MGKASVAGLPIMDAKYLPSGWASTVQYYKDPQFVYVHERSGEALNTPNEILCMMAQAKYDDMVNKGNATGYYTAQIDKNLCSQDQDSSSKAGSSNQSSGSSAPDYRVWTVRSIRADASTGTPQYVKAWVHETMGGGPGGGQEALILADIKITEASSSTNPYGLFTMNFAGYPYDKTTAKVTSTTPMMRGTLKAVKASTGKINLQFWSDQKEGVDTYSNAATLERSADGTTGGGEVQFTDHGWDQTTQKSTATTKRGRFAFDATSFNKQGVDTTSPFALNGSAICLDKTKYNYAVWSYGMYDSAGARVNLQSGFPIKDSKGNFGFVGNYGIFFPGSTTIADGDTVSKMDWSAGAAVATTYTVKKSGGKLLKYTRGTTTLDKLDGIKLSYGFFDSSTSKWRNINAHWDNATRSFIADSEWNQQTMSESTTNLPTISVTGMQWSPSMQMWSQGLGGQVSIQFPLDGTLAGKYSGTASDGTNIDGTAVPSGSGCTKTGGFGGGGNIVYACTQAIASAALVQKIQVIYYTQETVFPKDTTVPATLTCYSNCPDGTTLATTTANTSAYHSQGFDSQGNQVSYPYTFDSTAYTLKEGTTAISVTTKNSNLTAGQFGGSLENGLRTGILFDASSTTNTNLLKCAWDTTKVCAWDASTKLPTYYTWETGWNSYNALTSLIATDGTVLKFDQQAMVKFTYPSTATTVNATATDTKYAGKAFQLQYGGFRQLWGIPGKCVGMDKGEAVACGPSARFVPEFVIPDATAVTYSYAKSDGTSVANATGYIKALDMEKQMQAGTTCSATLSAFTLLTSADWVAPENSTTEPTVTDPPAVIGGVVQK